MKQLMYKSVIIDEGATDVDDYYITPCHPDGGEWELKQVIQTPITEVATHASNFRSLSVKNGSTELGSWTSNSSGGTALTEAVPAEVDVSGNGQDAEFTANVDPVKLSYTVAASGVIYKAEVTCVFERVS